MRQFYLVAAMFAAGSAAGRVEVLFFVSTDCPISNSFAPEIQRICGEYAAKGVGCSLVYEDIEVDAAAVRKHLADYGYERISTVIDTDRRVARRAGATITPEAVVIDSAGKVLYRGRIDNSWADFGKPRRVVTVHDVRDALDAVLAGKTVTNPETKALGCYIAPPELQRTQK
jgi:thiol-disulfide isomerase/thioredoxin